MQNAKGFALFLLWVIAATGAADAPQVVLLEPPVEARFVRLEIFRTNGGEPALDELEVFGPGADRNLALASAGALTSASSCIQGFPSHAVEHLADGQYGNEHSWCAADGYAWAQIELPEAALVGRVVFSRDRSGVFADRVATVFELRLSLDGQAWKSIVTGEALEARRAAALKALQYGFNPPAIRLAIEDLSKTFPDRYTRGAEFLKKLDELEPRSAQIEREIAKGSLEQIEAALEKANALLAFQREALLANPLLDFDELLILKREVPARSWVGGAYWDWGGRFGFTPNWASEFRSLDPSISLPTASYRHDALAAVALRDPQAPLRPLFDPGPQKMLQHPELHFDADRVLFTMGDANDCWQVFEMDLSAAGRPHQVTPSEPDIDNGDACYLPDGRIVFNSTCAFNAVPCDDGLSRVSGLCLLDPRSEEIRLLTFDQESNWHPSLLASGRVLYTRYEYANISHQYGRLLFSMNPDGTNQMAYYGTNSYWPNSMFFARAIPGHPTMVAATVCGHHGTNREGPLFLLDPAQNRSETGGAVQQILRHGKKVERIVEDQLYHEVFPKFAHPWPLSEKYFIVAARMGPESRHGIYLVDAFDNMTLIREVPGHSLLEPIPLKARPRPPVVADKVDLASREGTVYLTDVYRGPGLRDVPRGKVKRLRLFAYNYYYRDANRRGFGHLATVGVEGPWEPRTILGTVPVNEDGSALFKVPANLPISVQPLDEQGRALQVMRSWLTVMPGETLSCVGCHEHMNTSPPSAQTEAARKPPAQIEPWHGPARGFDFECEVQPVLDRHCVGCHDGSKPERPDLSRKTEEQKLAVNRAYWVKTESADRAILTPAFLALHAYVRRPNAESNYAMQAPLEFHASTSPLIRMLEKGHHNVKLSPEDAERLYAWIDLGAPDLGSWKNSEWGVQNNYYERRLEVYRRWANRTLDVEWMPGVPQQEAFVAPVPETTACEPIEPPAGWPLDAAQATALLASQSLPRAKSIEVADGLSIEFVLVPPGAFLMGEAAGAPDERQRVMRVEKPFYMSRCEVTNAQYRALAGAGHDSGMISFMNMDWTFDGYAANLPGQPVVRVSFDEAQAFCRALSQKSGARIALPTEEQWEWACRAGAATALWYGSTDDDFSACENLAGREMRDLVRYKLVYPAWFLREDRYGDGATVAATVGSYRPNPWGLYDMAGNVCEWTRTPYQEAGAEPAMVVRGGSWADRPTEARSAMRWKYPTWQRIYNVGFRLILEPADEAEDSRIRDQ